MEDRKFVLKTAIEATADDDGVVTPDGVIEAARDENSPLHGEFEWDDSIAASEHRRAQARALIREIRYVSLDITESVVRKIAYVHDPRLSPKEQGYISLDSAARDKKLAADVMMAELNRCDSALKRAEDVAKMLGVDLSIEKIRALVEAVKVKVAESPKLPPPRRSNRDDRPPPPFGGGRGDRGGRGGRDDSPPPPR